MKASSAIASLVAIVGLASADDGPVTRVVSLLEELKSRIETDGAEEQKVYDKYACWCETTTARKAAAITEARTELKLLGTTILKLKGTISTRTAEIKELLGDIKENEEAQKKATAIRSRENADFVAEKTETQQALAALEKALAVLNANTFIETREALSHVHAAVEKASRHVKLNSRQRAALSQLVHGRAGAAYAPQSATIQGILSDMYHTFASNLEKAEHSEATLHRNYEALMDVKHKELVTLQETSAKKQQEKAEAETILADATQNYADTEEQMKADIKFFDVTKESCEGKTEEWSKRKELRASELEGISEALKILTSDEAKELFAKSIKPGVGTGTFLQIDATMRNSRAARAFKALEAHARASHSLRLAALASSLRLEGGDLNHKSGHFDVVIKAIDKLMATLKDEQAADDEKVTDCKDQFQELSLKIEDLEWKIENNNAKIQKMEEVVSAKENEKEETVKELERLAEDIKQMESTRQSENEAYGVAKDDDAKAIELLEQAKEKLEEYYKKHGKAFVQISEEPSALDDPDVAPEAKFSGKSSRKNESKGIIALLTIIIEDLQEEIKSSKEAEEAAQLDFEKRLEAAKSLQSDLETKQTNLEEQISVKNDEIEKEKGVLQENTESKENEETTEADIKPECDWFIKNLAERRSKRKTEMEGLVTAKQYLAGAKPPVGLTELKRHSFDDDAFGQINFGAVSFLQRRS